MLSIPLPKTPLYERIDDRNGRLIIKGCYPGYGTTLGNALRRVLLSSLPGAAVTMVKIKGVTHEFTTLKGVKEDVVQIILNLKSIRFKLHSDERAVVFLKAKGTKEVTARDIECSADVEIANPEQLLATLTTSSASLEMEIQVEKGVGYVPTEQQAREEKEIGAIAVDAFFNPVRQVNFSVDNMRVGKRTDYDKITLEITTDGTISPQEAYQQAVEILMSQFNAIAETTVRDEEKEQLVQEVKEAEEEKVRQAKEEEKASVKKAEEAQRSKEEEKLSALDLSTRSVNILENHGIKNAEEISQMTEKELLALEGMGEKGVKEIKKAISKFGYTLKPTKNN